MLVLLLYLAQLASQEVEAVVPTTASVQRAVDQVVVLVVTTAVHQLTAHQARAVKGMPAAMASAVAQAAVVVLRQWATTEPPTTVAPVALAPRRQLLEALLLMPAAAVVLAIRLVAQAVAEVGALVLPAPQHRQPLEQSTPAAVVVGSETAPMAATLFQVPAVLEL
jgi:hypothetical protein